MRINTKVVCDIDSGEILYRESFEYEGPISSCAKGQSQAASNQLNLTNQVAGQYGGAANTINSNLVPNYYNLMTTGYETPGEAEAATTSGMSAANAPFGAAQFTAANRAAATNNPADLTSEQTKLAMEQGQAAGNEANALQQQKQQGQLAGASGLANLSDEDLRAMESLYGLGPGTLQARAAGQSTLSQIGQFVGDIGGAAAKMGA